jgi:hypothetical protein
LFAVPLLSAYRGFFQGMQNMIPIALSQLIEQIFRVAVGLYLAYVLAGTGLEEAAAGATFGASAGGIAALLLIYLMFFFNRKNIKEEISLSKHNKTEPVQYVIKSLLYIAVPITIGASIAPLMGNMDSFIVSNRLAAIGYTVEEYTRMFGELSGTAQTLINFPQVFSTAVAMSLVPSITEAFTKKKVKCNCKCRSKNVINHRPSMRYWLIYVSGANHRTALSIYWPGTACKFRSTFGNTVNRSNFLNTGSSIYSHTSVCKQTVSSCKELGFGLGYKGRVILYADWNTGY